MPAYPSRTRRPEHPAPLKLTDRDRAVLVSVFRHRYLASRHVHALHFASSSLRAAQRRLRRLWAHGMLDRVVIPSIAIGADGALTPSGGPLYCLATAGARVVSGELDVPFGAIPSTPHQNRVGFATLTHHLVATDWLVGLETHARPRLVVRETVRERTMRRAAGRHHGVLVPDAAACVEVGGARAWIYLEVVRADPRGGTRTLIRKLERYAEQRHQRAFARSYGHAPLRLVLFATPTEARAERLRVRAQRLAHGRRLFAFGAYGPGSSLTAPSAWSAATVDTPTWRTVDEETPASLSALLSRSDHAT